MLSPLKEKPKTPVQPPSCHIAPSRTQSQRVEVILFRQTNWTIDVVNVDKISHFAADAEFQDVPKHRLLQVPVQERDMRAMPFLTRHRGVTCQDPPSEL